MAGAIYAWPNIVTLDSKDYVVQPPVTVQPVEDWAIGIRQGAPNYEHREHIQFRSFEDFGGGAMLKWGSATEHPDRFWESAGVRTWGSSGDITLAPLVQSGGSAGTGTAGGDFAVYPIGSDQLFYVGLGAKIYKKLGASAWTEETTGLTFTKVHDLTTFRAKDPTSTSYNVMMAAFGAAKYGRYRNGVWDAPATGSSPNGWSYEYADDFLPYENMILKMYFGEIQASLNGATWTDIAAIPGSLTFLAFFAGVGLNGMGDLVPYAVAEGKLYAIDVWTHQKVEISVGMSQSITHAIVWQDGEVICTDGYTVKAYHPDRPVRDMGFDNDHGLGPDNFGSIKGLFAVQGKYLIAAVERTGTHIQLFLWLGGAWHNLTGDISGAWTGTGCMLGYYNGASLFNPLQQLWIVVSGGATYYLACDGFRNPLLNAAHKYAESGWLITADFDGGFAEVPGSALEVECFADLTATETVRVDYTLNGSLSGFTTLGTFNNTTTRLKFASGAGLEFKSIRFRFVFARGTTVTTTPIVHAIVFKYLKIPKLRRRIAFTVDAEQTARQRVTTPEAILDELYALVAATTLKTLTWVGEGTYYVKVVTMPRFDYMESRTTVTKISDIRVECLQPVED